MIIFTKNHHQGFCWLTLLERTYKKCDNKFAAMQSASLLELSPFESALFLEAKETNQWKVIL